LTPNPPIVGVTGTVAAGKSTFSRALERLGARRIDVDALGHEALRGREVVKAVAEAFGRAVLASDGSIDRRALAGLAFGTAESRRRLEAIVHPVVRRRIDEEIADAISAGVPFIVIDCALLFESGLDSICDATVVVDAPAELRRARAAAAHGWSADEMERRERAQLSAEEKRARADRTIVNDADTARLERVADQYHPDLLRRPGVASPRRTTS
jgi:dephospho-CoA kinase